MVQMQKFIDKHVGDALCNVFGLSPVRALLPSELPLEPRHILIVRLWAMGEALLTLPMMQSLRERFPEAKIDVLVTSRVAHLFERLPFIDEIIFFGPRAALRHHYDLVIDTEPYLRVSSLTSWYLGKHVIGFDTTPRSKLYDTLVPFNDQQHEVHTFMDLLRPLGIVRHPKTLVSLAYTPQEIAAAKKLLRGLPRPYIGVCATAAESASMIRRYPPARFIEASKMLIKKCKGTLIYVGTKAEHGYNEDIVKALPTRHAINAAGCTTFGELVALLSRCDAFISNDTGPMHLAAAQGTPTLGLFGPNLPVRFRPFGDIHDALYMQQYCSPCINVHRGEIDKYHCKSNICMQAISPSDVVEHTLKLLKKRR